jgi:hypothetical protein
MLLMVTSGYLNGRAIVVGRLLMPRNSLPTSSGPTSGDPDLPSSISRMPVYVCAVFMQLAHESL